MPWSWPAGICTVKTANASTQRAGPHSIPARWRRMHRPAAWPRTLPQHCSERIARYCDLVFAIPPERVCSNAFNMAAFSARFSDIAICWSNPIQYTRFFSLVSRNSAQSIFPITARVFRAAPCLIYRRACTLRRRVRCLHCADPCRPGPGHQSYSTLTSRPDGPRLLPAPAVPAPLP